jgi:hypothetical protein
MKSTLCLIGAILAIVSTLFVVPVQAQSPLADVREQINGILVQLQTFDNTCIVILGAQIKEIDIDVLEMRKLITTNKGNLDRLLLDAATSARAHLNRVFSTLTQCGTLLGTGHVIDDGSLFAEVHGVGVAITNLSGLNPRKEAKISGLIEHTIFGNLGSIRERLFGEGFGKEPGGPVPAMRLPIAQPAFFFSADFSGLLGFNSVLFEQLAACVFDLMTGNFSFPNIPSSCSSLLDFVPFGAKLDVVEAPSSVGSHLPTVPQLAEKGPIPFELLRVFKIALGIAHQRLVQAQRVLRQITQFKKWVYKGVREVHNLLRASNFGGRGAAELLSNISKIYTLDGALVETQAHGLLNTARLSNGVYLAVTESQAIDGKVIVRVDKMVIAR